MANRILKIFAGPFECAVSVLREDEYVVCVIRTGGLHSETNKREDVEVIKKMRLSTSVTSVNTIYYMD